MKRLLFAAVLLLPLLAARFASAEEHHKAEAEPGAKAEEHAGGHEAAHGEEHSSFSLLPVILLQVFAFVLLMLALKKFALPVLAGMLKERQDRIAQTYDKLEKEKAELARLTKVAQEKLAGIEKEAAAKLEAAVKEGTAQRAAILEEAGAAAARLLAKAKTEIEMERAKAIEEIRQEMVRLSLEAAERLVKSQLNATKQEELVEKFIAELERVKA